MPRLTFISRASRSKPSRSSQTSALAPTDWGELVQVHDDRAFQASPVELPDIDIHSL